MPDIREKPKIGSPKVLERSARLPKEFGYQLKEKYVKEQPAEPSEGAGEYAVNRAEDAAKDSIRAGGSALHGGVRHIRQQVKAQPRTPHGQYTRASDTMPFASGSFGSTASNVGQAPAAHQAYGMEPLNGYSSESEYTGDIPEPRRGLWKERANEARKGRCRKQAHSAHAAGAQGYAASQNTSQIETHFDIKEHKRNTAIKERDITAKSTAKARRPMKSVRPALKVPGRTSAKIPRRAAKQAEKQAKQRAVRETAKKSAQAAKSTGKAVARVGRTIASAVAKGVGAIITAGGGGVLIVVLLFIGVIAAVAASPFGLFFAGEKNGPDTFTVAEAVAIINDDYNTQLAALQSAEHDRVVLNGQAASWPEVLAVFAAKTAGADDGTDVATLDSARVDLLKAVFWDMTELSCNMETIDIPDSGQSESILNITVIARGAGEMRTVYSFTDYQNSALTELLAEFASLSTLAGDLSVTSMDAKALLDALPEGLSAERRSVVTSACMLVGKVNYFWGGKSLTFGWDSRWGTMRQVTSPGSKTTGTWRPFGLDCSGFVDWAFYNATGGEYVIGHGYGTYGQHAYCTDISWSSAQPGDLVFYPGDSHVGIVGGRDAAGNLLVIHCASGQNNVVITGIAGFTTVSRPIYYTE